MVEEGWARGQYEEITVRESKRESEYKPPDDVKYQSMWVHLCVMNINEAQRAWLITKLPIGQKESWQREGAVSRECERRQRDSERERAGNTVCVWRQLVTLVAFFVYGLLLLLLVSWWNGQKWKMLENCRQAEKERERKESKSHNNKMRINHKCH